LEAGVETPPTAIVVPFSLGFLVYVDKIFGLENVSSAADV
jgi:hypothetical protein